MKKISLLLLGLSLCLTYGCHHHHDHDHDHDHHHRHDHDHHAVEIPSVFRGLVNPLAGDDSAITKGHALYITHCMECHGETARGDGVEADSLDHAVTDLTDEHHANLDDDYMFWRIHQGGDIAPFHSAMPSFADTLSDNEIWKTITYLRTLMNP